MDTEIRKLENGQKIEPGRFTCVDALRKMSSGLSVTRWTAEQRTKVRGDFRPLNQCFRDRFILS